MPRIDPYKYDYDYDTEPSTTGAMLFFGVLAAIIVASFLWANYNPQPTGTTTPRVTQSQPATPSTVR